MARYKGRIYGSQKMADAARRRDRAFGSGYSSHNPSNNDNSPDFVTIIFALLVIAIPVIGVLSLIF